jgi:hypothetical protein
LLKFTKRLVGVSLGRLIHGACPAEVVSSTHVDKEGVSITVNIL